MASKKIIYAFGDSIMRGVVVDEQAHTSDSPKYKLLNDCFVEQCAQNFHIPIFNFARFGSTVANGLKQLERHTKDIQPDTYVFLEFGGNDCAFNWQEVSDHPEDEHLPATTLQNFVHGYENIIDKLKSLKANPILMSLPAIDASRYFKHISRNLNFLNIRRWMHGDINYIVNWHEMYNIAVFRLARSKNVPIVDISTIFLEKRNYSDYLCEDGIHPNENGHAMIADAIRHFVATEIPDARY